MPYVVTKKQVDDRWSSTRWPVLSRKAFATREEMLAECPYAVDALEEVGGPITLTSGVAIECEPVEMTELLGMVVNAIIDELASHDDRIIEFFNEREDR